MSAAPLAAGAAVLAPLLAALLLLAAPRIRRLAAAGRWIERGGASIALAATAYLAADDAGPLWRPDGLSAFVAALVAALACGHAWTPPTRAGGARSRAMLALAGLELAVLPDNMVCTWLGVALATLAAHAPGRRPAGATFDRRTSSAVLLGLAVAWAATMLLAQAASPALGRGLDALSWTAMGRAAAACDAALLSLAFPLALVGYGAAALASASAGITGLAILAVAATTLLRLHTMLAADAGAVASGTILVATGLLLLAGAAAMQWMREEGGFPVCAVAAQAGAVLVAFGLGGPAATAGLLHLALVVLSSAAALSGGSAAAAGVGALALLPPFGPLASAALLLGAVARDTPWLVVPLALGVGASALALLRRLPLWPRPHLSAADAPAWLELGAAALLGLAMPAGMAAWFARAAAVLP